MTILHAGEGSLQGNRPAHPRTSQDCERPRVCEATPQSHVLPNAGMWLMCTQNRGPETKAGQVSKQIVESK